MIRKVFKHLKAGTFIDGWKRWVFRKKNKRNFSNDEKFLSERFNFIFGYYPNMESPKTFNEKLMWLKLYWRDDRCYNVVDKYAVRNYVKNLGLENILVPLYGVYNNWNEINFNYLPNQFIIKTTHGGGGAGIYIIKDKLDKKQLKMAEKKIEKSLNSPKENHNKEWVYDKIERKIIIEELLTDSNHAALIDYKFYCFNGKAYYVVVATNREISVKFDYFDMDWKWFDLRQGGENNVNRPKKPQNFDKMIQIAELLSDDFPHVRVDLYNINGQIYFGELTFFDSAGNAPFDPPSFDYEFGEKININKIEKV